MPLHERNAGSGTKEESLITEAGASATGPFPVEDAGNYQPVVAARALDDRRASAHPAPVGRLRLVISVGLLGGAVAIMATKAGDLESAASRLRAVDPGWIAVAVVAEAGSLVALARLQQRLLRAGGVRLTLPSMTAITTAGNAVDATMPGGLAWAAAWLFDQYGRRGVPRFLRVWMFLVAGGISSFALFLLITAGIELAGGQGPVSSLRWPALLLAMIPVVALVVELTHHTPSVHWLLERGGNLLGGGRLERRTRTLVEQFSAVRLRPLGWAEVLGLGLCNWLLDAVVLIAALSAMGIDVPWRAILVVYGLTQVTASLPLTPGGIGVVGGSLVALLTAYGVPFGPTLSAVFLYRLLTFWALVPIGWAVWGTLEVRGIGGHLRSGTPVATTGTTVSGADARAVPSQVVRVVQQ